MQERKDILIRKIAEIAGDYKSVDEIYSKISFFKLKNVNLETMIRIFGLNVNPTTEAEVEVLYRSYQDLIDRHRTSIPLSLNDIENIKNSGLTYNDISYIYNFDYTFLEEGGIPIPNLNYTLQQSIDFYNISLFNLSGKDINEHLKRIINKGYFCFDISPETVHIVKYEKLIDRNWTTQKRLVINSTNFFKIDKKYAKTLELLYDFIFYSLLGFNEEKIDIIIDSMDSIVDVVDKYSEEFSKIWLSRFGVDQNKFDEDDIYKLYDYGLIDDLNEKYDDDDTIEYTNTNIIIDDNIDANHISSNYPDIEQAVYILDCVSNPKSEISGKIDISEEHKNIIFFSNGEQNVLINDVSIYVKNKGEIIRINNESDNNVIIDGSGWVILEF